jgi:hypothetical protein
LILASWGIGIACLLGLSPSFPSSLGRLTWFEATALLVGPSVAGALFLAGVIAWALAGAIASDLENLQRQNQQMIDLLKRIADNRPGAGGPPRPGGGLGPDEPAGPGGGINGPEPLDR